MALSSQTGYQVGYVMWGCAGEMEVECGYVSKDGLQGAINDLKEKLKRDAKQNYQVCAH